MQIALEDDEIGGRWMQSDSWWSTRAIGGGRWGPHLSGAIVAVAFTSALIATTARALPTIGFSESSVSASAVSRGGVSAVHPRISVRAIRLGREVRVSGSMTGISFKGRRRWLVRLQERIDHRWRTRLQIRATRVLRGQTLRLTWQQRGPASTAAAPPSAGPPLRVTATGPGGATAASPAVRAVAVPVAAAVNCTVAHLIAVRGSEEKESDYGGYGRTLDSVKTWVGIFDPSIEALHINYEAIGVQVTSADYYAYAYQASVESGIIALLSQIAALERCPKPQPIYLVGYSQGAQVIADTYQMWLHPAEQNRVTRMALIGDPKFMGGQGVKLQTGSSLRAVVAHLAKIGPCVMTLG